MNVGANEITKNYVGYTKSSRCLCMHRSVKNKNGITICSEWVQRVSEYPSGDAVW